MPFEWTKVMPSQSTLRALWAFLKREWVSMFVASGVGILGAGIMRLLRSDQSFSQYSKSKYLLVRGDFEGWHVYAPFVLGLSLMLLIALLPRAAAACGKGLRSWFTGVTSGLQILCFASAFTIFAAYQASQRERLILSLEVDLIMFLICYALYLSGVKRIQRPVREEDVRVRDADVNAAGTRVSNSDDPITDWPEDILGRAPIIDALTFSLLITKTPVVALFGRLGSGKTSVLNLLYKHLTQEPKPQAVVVLFNTWLPGSSETLASYLLDDIARECSKLYVVPGIRKDARKLALALAKNIPLLSSVSDLFSNSTQRDDIQRLADAVSRLPRRVVVLLDEVDRMQRTEILELLKVLRGVSVSLNLSFVCALDREKMEQEVVKTFSSSSNVYFEKFFQTSVNLPVIDGDALKAIGVRRLVSTLENVHWFEVEADEKTFREEIDKLWDDLIAPFCQTPRSIGLLANDVSAACLPLKDEVNPVDLTLIEMLRRFEPAVFEIVWRYREILTGQERSLARYHYRSDDEIAAMKKGLLDELSKAVEGDERLASVKGVLRHLFPLFAEIDGKRLWPRGPKAEGIQTEKSIADPNLIKAYFYQKLPEDLYGSKEMATFLQTIGKTASFDMKVAELSQVLDSMEKGNPRRQNFLEKLSERVKTIDLPLATELAHACMVCACKYSYDLFVSVAEAGDALRILIRVTDRTAQDQRAAFLAKCILESGDDTLAFRIQTVLSKPGTDFSLGVSFAELYPSFVERMRQRYGLDIDTTRIDLTCSDPRAFGLWAASDLTKEGVTVSPEERAIQRDFWIRYIGNNAVRLAHAFNTFLMPEGYSYSGNPAPIVESMIPVADLQKLYDVISSDQSLGQDEHESLQRLGDFLAGKFKNGVNPF